MDFIDAIAALAARIPKLAEHIRSEEATKSALVLPFIEALGYNIFDPMEVTPELTADVGVKKGERVDYAILRDGDPVILFECKGYGSDLSKEHASQLYRYFAVTNARFGVLTDGAVYRFFTDLEEPNKMDSKPFFEFSMAEVKEAQVEELKRFTKSSFDVDSILATASEMKYTREIKRIFGEQMSAPADDFVRFFAAQVYPGKLMSSVREQFAEITKRALHQFVSDRVSDRLKLALEGEAATAATAAGTAATDPKPAGGEEPPRSPSSETTQEEIEGYLIVKSIIREVVDPKRVTIRDVLSHCSVLLDDTNRKPICRLRFHAPQKSLGLIGEKKQEEVVPIADLDDIYKHSDRLKAAVGLYS